MGCIKTIVGDAKELKPKYSVFFTNPVNENVFKKLAHAIRPFNMLGDKLVGVKFVFIPVKEDPTKVMNDKAFGVFLNRKLGSFVVSSTGLRNVLKGHALHENGVILSLDDINENTLRHEIFHYIHEFVLTEKAKHELDALFNGLKSGGRKQVNKRQRNTVSEYFAYGGEYFLSPDRFFGLFSRKRKLRKRDPALYDFIDEVLNLKGGWADPEKRMVEELTKKLNKLKWWVEDIDEFQGSLRDVKIKKAEEDLEDMRADLAGIDNPELHSELKEIEEALDDLK
jgi:hypothetical protein